MDGVVGVAEIANFEVVSTGSAGTGDDTVFQAGSLSKSVTSAVALELVERGVLDLDADVGERLTSWHLPGGAGPTTLRDLLGHTAGVNVPFYPGYAQGRPVPTLTRSLDGVDPTTTPAVTIDRSAVGRFRYSGGGYTIVQQLVEDVTSAPFAEAARTAVLDPFGMQRSTFLQPPPEPFRASAAWADWHVYPESAAAGLWTTPADLARFVCALQAAAGGNPSALSRSTAQAMTNSRAALPRFGQWTLLRLLGLAWPKSSGLGVFVGEDRFINLGGAVRSFSALTGSVVDGTGAVVMTAGCRSPVAVRILLEIGDARGWTGLRVSRRGVRRRTSDLLLRGLS